MSDIYELAGHLCGIPEDDEGSQIDDALFDRYEVDADQLEKIVTDLLPLIDVGKSPLTGKRYKGFSTGKTWLAKKEL